MNANRTRGAGLAAAVVAASLLGASPAQAFCVYNKTDANIKVLQVGGGIGIASYTFFIAELAPGKDSCCNWQNKDCNSGGKRSSKVAFAAFADTLVYKGDRPSFPWLLCAAETTANGAISVVGSLPGSLPTASSAPFKPDTAWGNTVECKSYAGPPAIVIVNKGSAMCLDVKHSQDRNGAEVVTWDCNAGLNQNWEYTNAGEIRGLGNRCLDVTDASNKNNAKVQMWDCNNNTAQKWRLVGETIVGVGSNKCLYGGNKGARLVIYDCSDSKYLKWTRRDE